MRLRWLSRLAISSCALITVGAALPAAPVGAQVPNCTPVGQVKANYHDAMLHVGGATLGVMADIQVRHGAVCDTDSSQSNLTTAWVMLYDTGGKGWMQSGHIRWYGSTIVHFAQFQNADLGGGIPVTMFGAVASTGAIYRYWTQYAPDAEGEFHLNYDVVRLINVAYGVGTYHWSGFAQAFSGETTYFSSDIPGNTFARSNFSGIKIQSIVPPYGFSSIPCPFLTSTNDNPARWASPYPTSCTGFSIWTL